MTWENKDRLLLAPLGKALLCAAFPERGTSERPTFQPPRKVRTITRKYKEKPQIIKKQKSRQRHRPYPATTSKPESSNGPCVGLFPEATLQSKITPSVQQPQSEQSPMMSATVSSRAACLSPGPALQGMLGTHGDQLVHRRLGATGTAGCMADPSNLNSDAIDVSELYHLYEHVIFDGLGDQ